MTTKDLYVSAKCQEIEALIAQAKQWAKGDAKLGPFGDIYKRDDTWHARGMCRTSC